MSKKRIDDNEILVTVLSSGSYAEAARILGISKQTVSRRMKDEQLKNRVIEYRKNILDAVNMRLIEGASKAIDVLLQLLESENEVSRYNSASKILGLVQDFVDSADIISQIDRLKAEAEQRQ